MRVQSNKFVVSLFFLGFSSMLLADIIESFDEYSPSPKKKEQVLDEGKNFSGLEKHVKITTDEKNSGRRTAARSFKGCKVFFRSSGVKGTRQNGIIELKKNVYIRKCSLEITSKKAYIYFDSKKETVLRITALGNVDLKNIEPRRNLILKAKGDKLVYEVGEELIELVGKDKRPATMQRNYNSFSSKKIIYDIRNDAIQSNNVEGTISAGDKF